MEGACTPRLSLVTIYLDSINVGFMLMVGHSHVRLDGRYVLHQINGVLAWFCCCRRGYAHCYNDVLQGVPAFLRRVDTIMEVLRGGRKGVS